MKHLNFLSKSGSQSMGLRSVTLALTVGSPSAHRRSTMLKLISILVLILTIGVGNVWGDTWSLTYTDFNTTSYSANDGSHEKGGISYTTKNVMQSSSKIQIKKSSAYIYNTTAMPGDITSITLSSGSNVVIKVGSSSQPSSGTTVSSGASVSSGNRYFYITSNGSTATVTTITVTYTAAAAKTLSSIAVKTAPTKVKYVAGENFDPSGLKITATYSDASKEDISYAAATFTLSPTTSTALTTSHTSVSISYGGKSTSQAINVYNVTMQARDEDGNTIPSGGPGAPSRTGKSISPAADANNYVFKEWQVTNASLGSGETTKSNTITNPTGAVTVTAVYHKPITITYKANGQDFTTQTYGYGGTLAFPASGPNGDAYSCTGKTFTGWVAEANKDYSHATTAPTYATAGGSVTTAATYYAVFANASGNKTTKTDNITRTTTGVTANSTNYSAWSGKTLTSSATYAGQSAGGNSAIQLRNQSPSGVISTASGGTLKKITITWNSNTTASRYVTIFGKATAYSQTSDLYNNSYKGTELGTIIKGTSTELNVTGTYNYVGILASAAIYIENIAVQWEVDNVTYTNFETSCCTPLGSINGSFFWPPFFRI